MKWYADAIADWRAGATLAAVGIKYGVTRQAIHRLLKRTGTWEPRPARMQKEELHVLVERGLPVERDPGKCWEWTRSRYSLGYGRITGDRLAHRCAYQVFVGPIPDGMQVLHRCDNPPCCNPAHLFIGTVKDNMQDRDTKGRGRYRRRT